MSEYRVFIDGDKINSVVLVAERFEYNDSVVKFLESDPSNDQFDNVVAVFNMHNIKGFRQIDK